MNAENKVKIKPISLQEPRLKWVIKASIGNPTEAKIQDVIRSYQAPNHEVVGAFLDDLLVGMIGIFYNSNLITIRHISIISDYQKCGIGKLLINEIKKKKNPIIVETDAESVLFYKKLGFSCHAFKNSSGYLRYNCQFQT